MPEMIGREDDIRRLTSLMREDKSFLNVVSDIGNGKSVLMEHLAWWWKEIRLFSRIAYVNVSLAKTRQGNDDYSGCLAVAKRIWQSVDGNRISSSSCADPMRLLVQAMETSKGQNVIVLLDGFDEVYPYLSNNCFDDTAKSCAEFFRVARLLSTAGFKLVVASSAPLPFLPDGTSDFLFEPSTRMTNEEVLQLIYPPSTPSQRPEGLAQSTDKLHCVFELLQYNRLALESQSRSIRGKFHGLDAILLWDGTFGEYSNYVPSDLIERRATEIQSLDLDDDCGHGRIHTLLLAILEHLAKIKRYDDLWAFLSIGLWIDVIPHPSQIMDIFEGDNTFLRNPIIQYVLDNIPKSPLNSVFLPFELWSLMRENLITKEAQIKTVPTLSLRQGGLPSIHSKISCRCSWPPI